jgi:hypothetical protein
MSGAEANNDVSDGYILGFTGSVRNHDTPAGSEGVLSSLYRLSESTNLVKL